MGFYNVLVDSNWWIPNWRNLDALEFLFFCLLFEGGNVESYSPSIFIEMRKYFFLLKDSK